MVVVSDTRFPFGYRPEIILDDGLDAGDYEELGLPYYSNRPLDEVDTNVKGVLVSLHGNGGDANEYLDRALDVMASATFAIDPTLVIAPQFINEEEVTGSIPDDALYWGGGRYWGNPSGKTSANPRTARIFSFDALDWLLEEICTGGHFPNVERIVIVGHSGGGQFINRYAATSPFREAIAEPLGISVHHIPMNPGDYLYLTDRRPVGGSVSQFAPGPQQACSDFDNWGRGLVSRWSYARRSSPDEIRARYKAQTVTYMVGSRDIEVGGDCAALAQGSSRLERGIAYYQHLVDTFGLEIAERHKLVIVLDAAHNGRAMMESDAGVREIVGPFATSPGSIGLPPIVQPPIDLPPPDPRPGPGRPPSGQRPRS